MIALGPIDSADHWQAFQNATLAAYDSAAPRSEVVLAGLDLDKPSAAAIRVGRLKLLVGEWGAGSWCDLNASG